MKLGLSVILLFLSFSVFASDPIILVLRKLLSESNSDKNSANLLYHQTKNYDEKDTPLLLGFRAMGEFMQCNFTGNAVSKYSHFYAGKKLLETAISKASETPELIYFRLITQTSAPSFLGYTSHIAEDKTALINFLETYNKVKNEDPSLFSTIKNYLLKSKVCTATQKEKIEQL